MLDTRLQQSQARETGICPIRRELYSQAFGKIQDNPQQQLKFNFQTKSSDKWRSIAQNVDFYYFVFATKLTCATKLTRLCIAVQLLLECGRWIWRKSRSKTAQNSLLFQSLQAQEGKEQLQQRIHSLEEEKAVIEATISDMKVKADQAERRNLELRESEEKKHSEEIAFLKKTNSQLKAQLEGIIATKK